MSFFKKDPYDNSLFQSHPEVKHEEPPERKVWQYMIKYQEEKGLPPTLDEISAELPSQHRSSARHFVQKLVDAGWVEEVAEEGKSRRYRATNAIKEVESPDDLIVHFNSIG